MAQPNPELRDPQQALADVRGELHECTDERDAAQAPELATAEVLRMINGSGGHVTPVFKAILEKALTLCEAAFGFLTVYDGERFELAAQRSVPEALAAYFATGIDQPRPGDAHWRLLRGEKLVHNLDQKDEDAYRSGNPLRRAVVDLGGARSTLVVALSREADVRGTLTIYRKSRLLRSAGRAFAALCRPGGDCYGELTTVARTSRSHRGDRRLESGA